ncbi:2-succinyl-5-enolpyruvyl-6-hydroxy-3-cyclohexene-1-carboxylate synthase [Microbacterium bovistercoris]|uniref:2-succinyl-5-enolpyruvyl-6-hydroxy-3-cyclohexene-1-carboxylate synthase n=1 Tax=Microbacterium bovistercoris TaxID=2293570 RepID=A0A371NXE7_9MICO|nr:thiamine pyrophosphate-binding protein [Microbacterium bovistercoris]REJ07881.1 2-succinyl-5-enolpyruvyl-6-hydroxy-3-cyclohexene-1-carboxylate synthase [Microbacterium bovistercoris]
MTGSPASTAAGDLLADLIAHGVRDLVLSPGSRSQALALAATALDRAGLLRVHVRVDERVAGFTALGIARETRVPVAVVCTSGTAAGNLLPAVMEAFHSGVPLLLMTADRPPELRGVGANQATVQTGIFGPFVRWTVDAPVPGSAPVPVSENTDEMSPARRAAGEHAVGAPECLRNPTAESGAEPMAGTAPVSDVTDEARAAQRGGDRHAAHHADGLWGPTADAATAWSGLGVQAVEAALGLTGEGVPGVAGPVHLNLPAREPLSAATEVTAVPGPAPSPPASDPLLLARGPRTVVIAGADAGADAEEIAHAGGWPLIAEIVSGSRFGRQLVHDYRGLLRDERLGGRVERAVVFGHPTLSREVTALLSRRDVEVIAVRGGGEPLDLNARTTAASAVTVEAGETDRQWLGAWMIASQAAAIDLSEAAPDQDGLSSKDPLARAEAVRAELDAVRRPVDRALLADAVWRATWPHDRLVFGSSRLVRVADQVLGGKKVPVHANRGLAGIDGTIATAIGIAVASQGDGALGVTRVLLGDLAALHDVGALLLPAGERAPRIQVVVGNDGGGTIFDGLEVAASAPQNDLDRAFYTPHAARFADLAAAYGWEYQRVSTRSALDQALTSPVTGPQLIEVPLERR